MPNLAIVPPLTPQNYQQHALRPAKKKQNTADAYNFFSVEQDKRICKFCM
jgi:hypothetical protein